MQNISGCVTVYLVAIGAPLAASVFRRVAEHPKKKADCHLDAMALRMSRRNVHSSKCRLCPPSLSAAVHVPRVGEIGDMFLANHGRPYKSLYAVAGGGGETLARESVDVAMLSASKGYSVPCFTGET